jgi:hypothetical protein
MAHDVNSLVMPTNSASTGGVKSLTLEIVSSGPRLAHNLKGGRPVKLTSRAFIRICRFVEAGGTENAACTSEQIRFRTLYLHVSRKPTWKQRLDRAREVRKAVWREMHTQNILKQAPKNVVASLWWLERNYPDEYALRTVSRMINSHELVLDKLSPEQLADDIRLAKQVEMERPALT